MSPGKVRVIVLLNVTGDAAAAANVGAVKCGLFVSNDHGVCLSVLVDLFVCLYWLIYYLFVNRI